MTVYEDRREAILVRLYDLMQTVDPSFDPKRNVSELSDTARYVVLLDGAEHGVGTIPGRRSANEPPPQLIEMTPEVQFRMATKVKDATNVGTTLNFLRSQLIGIVLTDPALLALTARGQAAHYEGAQPATAQGRSTEGGIGVAFTFTYLLRPGREA